MTSQRAPARIRRSVPLPDSIKDRLRNVSLPRRLWTSYRRAQVEREYRLRRDYYQRAASERGIAYSDEETTSAVRARLSARGYTVPRRTSGEVHTFICTPLVAWHGDLVTELRELGLVTHFDYVARGFSVEQLTRGGASAAAARNEMLAQLRSAFADAHARRPVDWMFCYGGGQDFSPAVIAELTETYGIPTVCLSLDDKQGWAGDDVGGWRTGAADITASFDLFITSSRIACEWHLVEGGRPLHLPPGYCPRTYHPTGAARDLDVSFVGASYGFRPELVGELRRAGIAVTTFGAGWPAGRVSDSNAVFNRSKVNLGMGGIEYSEGLTTIKGRDFEVPAAGGGLYLTSFDADLARFFAVGEEIVCYGSRRELVELVLYFLRNQDEAAAIAARAYERSVREHRWLHRFQRILGILDILE
ncbi:MAG TPA: glycosyltransferase [Thermoanaerobaculia bacterium]|nr:glycosyltransferase [Thermoanaerobaculia bacterium]